MSNHYGHGHLIKSFKHPNPEMLEAVRAAKKNKFRYQISERVRLEKEVMRRLQKEVRKRRLKTDII